MNTTLYPNQLNRCRDTLLQAAFCALFTLSVLPSSLSAFSETPPVDRTGSPGSIGTCAACHTSVGSGSLDLDFLSTSLTYEPGETYMMDVIVDDPGQARFGFSMVARTDSNPTIPTGTWIAGNDSQVYDNGEHVGHLDAPFADDTFTFSLNWTAPATDVGPITFFAVANAANGNGLNRLGDNVYLQSITINPAVAAATWGGYDLVDGMWIDTTPWIGWLAILDTSGGGTWAYSLSLDSFLYLSEEIGPTDSATWIFLQN